MSTTVAVLADLHVEPSCEDRLLATLADTCDEILTERHEAIDDDPDLLVVLGDVIQETEPHTDRRVIERVAAFFAELPLPVRVIPGNHDVMTLDLDRVLGAFDRCRETDSGWGIDTDRELVFLNSAAPRLADSRGELDDDQVAALLEHLPEMDDALVFVHHPIEVRDVSDNPWFGSYPEEAFCGNRRPLADVLGGENVSAVINGHLHEFDAVRSDGVLHVTVDAFNKTTGHEQDGTYALLTRTAAGESTAVHVGGDGTQRVVRSG